VRGSHRRTFPNPPAWCEPAGSASTGATAADIQTYVQSLHLPGIAGHQISVTASWPATGTACPALAPNSNNAPLNSPGCPVKVIVRYPYASQVPFIRITIITLTADSQMVISQ